MRYLVEITHLVFGPLGLVILGLAGPAKGMNCEGLRDYGPGVSPVLPGFHLKDSRVRVGRDGYIRETRLVYKFGKTCYDLGNGFSVSRLESVSPHFHGLDFSKPNQLEDFLDCYFEGLAYSHSRSLRPSLAYMKEEGIEGDHLLLIAVPQDSVKNNRWGSYEQFIYTRLECLSVNKNGRFTKGDSANCQAAVKMHEQVSRAGLKP